MSTPLSPTDATFLELEESDETAHMHIGGVLVFEPMPGRPAPTLQQMQTHLLERLKALPRYRQRLSSLRTGGLSWPHWEPDPDFDVDHHVRRAALPAPGGDGELTEWAAEFWSHRLDRRRALWECVLLEGLEGGAWALATKTHHCLVDGVGSVDVTYLVLDDSPDPPAHSPVPAPAVEDEPGGAAGPLRLARGLAGGVARAASDGLEALLHPAQLREAVERARAVADLAVRDELIAAPHTSLNQPMGTHRRYAVARVELDELRAIRASLGGTVNDAILAVTTGALRGLLVARGDAPPPQGLRAMVPMNLRGAADQLALGNRVTSLFVHLPVAEPDPLERYARTRAEVERLKAGSQAGGGEAVLELASVVPPVLHAFVARALFGTRLFNLTVTNVPGPRFPLFAFGAPMREILPLVPLAAAHTVGISVYSYSGRLVFGVIADRASVPDLDVLVEGIRASVDELLTQAPGATMPPARGPAS